MAFQDYLTVEGEQMLARAARGIPFQFTKTVMGQGYLSGGTSPRNVTELVSPVKELSIESVELSGENTVIIQSYFTNSSLEHSFFFREKGIYASDGEREILFIYGNADSGAEEIPTADVTVIEKKIRSTITLTSLELESLTLTNATNATAPYIDPDTSLEDFCGSPACLAMEVGRVAILKKKTYTYVGYDPTDPKCYSAGGSDEDREGSVTVIADDMSLIQTTYADGTKQDITINTDMTEIVEKNYNSDGVIESQYKTTINGNTITEVKEV